MKTEIILARINEIIVLADEERRHAKAEADARAKAERATRKAADGTAQPADAAEESPQRKRGEPRKDPEPVRGPSQVRKITPAQFAAMLKLPLTLTPDEFTTMIAAQ